MGVELKMIKICGNCNWYKFKNNPASKGGCINEMSGDDTKHDYSPLSEVCDRFEEKEM